ncbi:MAG: hypothetical protein V4564_13775 [Pseudomonadota bacterium]|uniref:hypothetical protein n=1 Tax=Sphingomonas sp. ERG5 TaxID=1381597 RepID=UPI000691A79D|nr:hypothetical protein [Sphingomonas sp. ERG5]
MDYPHHIDFVWLASDPDGQLAAMITAGSGPMPDALLAAFEELPDLESWMLGLPHIADAILLVDVPDPASCRALSEKGLFVYDWTDIHRPTSQCLNAYELVARPSVTLRLEELPSDLRSAAQHGPLHTSFGSPVISFL